MRNVRELDEADDGENLDPSLNGDRVDGIERVGLGISGVRQVHKLLDHHPEACEHAHTAVLDLGGLAPFLVEVCTWGVVKFPHAPRKQTKTQRPRQTTVSAFGQDMTRKQ